MARPRKPLPRVAKCTLLMVRMATPVSNVNPKLGKPDRKYSPPMIPLNSNPALLLPPPIMPFIK